ncbi:MAG TPA: MFS transporter [Acidimicrobiales bacterium]|nr:MFS transporter [Acidimicrobiales bacterium]
MHLLRQPRLALLFTGAALNEIGSWCSIIAFWGYAAYRFHSGPEQIALVSVMWMGPGALFSLVSGWPIDRFGPKAVMIAADTLGVISALGMMWSHSYGSLVVLVLVSGTVGAFGRPAATSLPPRLVDDDQLLAGNALLGLTTQLAIVIGPLLAAVVIALGSIRTAFLVDAITFVVGAASLVPLHLRAVESSGDDEPSASDVLAGLRFSWRHPTVRRTLMLGAAVFFTWGASMVMEPLYVRDVLHRSSSVFGFLQTLFGLGLIAATVVLPRMGDRVVTVGAQAGCVLASAATIAGYLGSRQLVLAAVSVCLWGAVTGVFIPPFYTLLQRATPTDTHGRVMATASMLNGVAGLIATPLAALAVAAIGVPATALIEAAGMLIVGWWGWVRIHEERSSPSKAAATVG